MHIKHAVLRGVRIPQCTGDGLPNPSHTSCAERMLAAHHTAQPSGWPGQQQMGLRPHSLGTGPQPEWYTLTRLTGPFPSDSSRSPQDEHAWGDPVPPGQWSGL